jgi:GNAT superfamily N-acetyltransferase
MANRAERSPLYDFGVSQSERRAIQAHNLNVIMGGIARYTFQSGEREVFLPQLNINGFSTDNATLRVRHDPSYHTFAEIKLNDERLCHRTFKISRDSVEDWAQTPIDFWRCDGSMLNTAPGYEGNGFGSALFRATETLMQPWIATLSNPPSRVLAVHFDGSYGAEEDANCRDGYRTGWTGNLLRQLGYQNGASMVEYYLGEQELKNINPDKCWIKVFRQ